MGCICSSDISVYEIDSRNQRLILVATIRGSHTAEQVRKLVGAYELYNVKETTQNANGSGKPSTRRPKYADYKQQICGSKITGQINPPIDIIRQIRSGTAKFKCQFCSGIFRSFDMLDNHNKICSLYNTGNLIDDLKKAV